MHEGDQTDFSLTPPPRKIHERLAMSHDIDSVLLARYFADVSTAEENTQITAWMREDPVRREYVRRLRELWETAGERPREWDTDAAWEEVVRQVEMLPEGDTLPALPGDRRDARPRTFRKARPSSTRRRSRGPVRRHQRKRSLSNLGQVLRYAAVVVVALVVGLLVAEWRQNVASDVAAPEKKVFITERGEQATIELLDGTRVLLNVDSKITYPSVFAKDRRVVYLQGQAFFDVAPNADRPFIVHSGNTVVRVLGTSFGVRAYAADEKAQVVVAEGRVAVHAPQQTHQDEQQDSIIARPGDVVTISAERMDVQHVQNLDRYLAWTEGRLVFEAAPFEQVARKLERMYDLRVGLTVPGDSVGRLSASFDDEPLTEIMNVIAGALGLDYRYAGRRVVFYPVGTPPPSL